MLVRGISIVSICSTARLIICETDADCALVLVKVAEESIFARRNERACDDNRDYSEDTSLPFTDSSWRTNRATAKLLESESRRVIRVRGKMRGLRKAERDDINYSIAEYVAAL